MSWGDEQCAALSPNGQPRRTSIANTFVVPLAVAGLQMAPDGTIENELTVK